MSQQKFSYEGAISYDYKKKVFLKTNIVLIPCFAATIFFLWLIYLDVKFSFELFLWISLYSAIIPYLVIVIPVHFYFKAFVRTFAFTVLENNIIINSGVFTKSRVTIPYSRIQNINIVNGVFDRIYKTFSVKVETAGYSGLPVGPGGGRIKPEGYIPGLKDPHMIENKIKEMMTKYSTIPSGLEDKIFKPEEIAFDNFISYILSKMREGEKLKTSIKELREGLNMTATKLAEIVGVPIQTINYLEEGRYNPSLTLAYKIAQALNCKIEDLFKLV